jgi:glutamate racemase
VLPAEHIIYLGDTARVPYGTKGAGTVVRYALGCARHLVGRGVKTLVVACNTVSAVAPERLRMELDVPVLGVIDPGARAAVAATRVGRIGVLATAGTIASGAYSRAVARLSTRAEVVGQAAPLLVPLAEEGWTDGEVPRLIVRRYIEAFRYAGVDVVVLGCTHYPLLRDVIEHEVHAHIGPHVRVVDSAVSTAEEVQAFLCAREIARTSVRGDGCIELLVTDMPQSFRESAARFLGSDIANVEQVDL